MIPLLKKGPLLLFRPFFPQSVYPGRDSILLLLIATLVTVQLHPAMPPWWVRAAALGLFLWRLGIERLGWPVPGRLILWMLAGLAVAAMLAGFHTFVGRDAGSVFLMLLLGLKTLEMRSRRDVMTVVFLIWWVTLTGFLFSQSPATAAAGLISGGLALTVLLRINQPRSVLGRRFSRDGGSMILLAVPIMLGMYLLFPRIQGGLWGLPDDALSARTGLTDEVRPGSIQHLLLNDAVAFRVRFSGAVPAPEKRYWRALVLESSDGQSWQRGALHKQPASLDLNRRPMPVHYTTTFEASPNKWLPVLDLPATRPPGTIARYGHVLESEKTLSGPLQLTLLSYPDAQTGALNPEERRINQQLAYPPTARVAALVARWQSEAGDPSSLVRSALRHFREESFFYSLSPPMLGPRPVDELLFETREGYCEHYATAFTTLMRVAGIPARLVVGYMGGEINEAGGYLVVRQSDAHAWSEVWIAGSGWTRVDPTAAIAPERIRYGTEMLRWIDAEGWIIGNVSVAALRGLLERDRWDRGVRWLRHRWDAVNYGWNEWVVAYGPARQYQLLRALGLDRPSLSRLILLLAGVSIVLLLLVQGLLSIRRSARDPVSSAYLRFLHRLARHGVSKGASEGPVDFAQRAVRQLPALTEPITEISRVYVAARYGTALPPGAASRIRRLTRAL
ncbi:MAG: DUF3488 and transglutaminase-like domain-containing protein [Arenicellales bacterium]|jgi:transglutaminase-like putative cysteine protease|nr:DUF3488 and transglutaminase-like domain-containing protein [Arenicellales bacterium]|tara:strand:- start:567 stop:2594 length:2028 start_codon:yes stop_codon:yes gene_type:complete